MKTCDDQLFDTTIRCQKEKDHGGLHYAHYTFPKDCAVWWQNVPKEGRPLEPVPA